MLTPGGPHYGIGGSVARSDDTISKENGQAWAGLISIPFIIGVVWLVYAFIAFAVVGAFKLVTNHYAEIALQGVLIVLVLVAGTGFYLLRCRARRVYSVVEFSVGVWGAVFAVKGLASYESGQPGAAFATIAALYIIVRALDNYHQSIHDESDRDKWERRFFGKKQ